MFAYLFHKIVVRNRVSTPVIRNTYHQFLNYSSAQIYENSIIKDSPLVTKNIDNSPSITKLLKSYDFSDTHIGKLFSKSPPRFSFESTVLIKTKLDFFLNVGFLGTHLAKFISANSYLLAISLDKRLKPNISLLKTIYGTEDKLVYALFRTSSLLQVNLETSFFPNIRTLTNHGVPHNNILKLANRNARTLLAPRKKFIEKAHLIASMGFDPCSTLFCVGLEVVTGISPMMWKKKVSLYKSLGWSEENVLSAFIRQPCCMYASEQKIKQIMDFFVNKRQCEPLFLAKHPVLISLSLEKRIMPRCFVMDILVKKQLVEKSSVINYRMGNKGFLEKYVIPYQHQAPEVLHAYNGDLNSVYLENISQIS